MKTNPRFVEEWGIDPIGPETTGLPGHIVILFGNYHNMRYGPSIMVSNLRRRSSYQNVFFVSLSDQPEIIEGRPKSFSAEELSAIFNWIVLNKDRLLMYWNHPCYSTFDFLDELESL